MSKIAAKKFTLTEWLITKANNCVASNHDSSQKNLTRFSKLQLCLPAHCMLCRKSYGKSNDAKCYENA